MKYCILFYMVVNLIGNAVFLEETHAKIVGGAVVDLKKYPHSGRFYNDGAMCGGVILSSYSMLTAAHCLDHNDETELMTVVVGSQSLVDFEGQWLGVSKVIVHEEYNTTIQYQCDMAIVFVTDKFKFGPIVQRVILVYHDKWMNPKEASFNVTGWGQTSFNGFLSQELLTTKLNYVNYDKCEEMNGIKLSPDIFCLYGHGVTDACKGDSGGGVIWNGMLVGITSHGKGGCSEVNKPSMYANVWYLRDWIETKLDEFVEDCIKNELTETVNNII